MGRNRVFFPQGALDEWVSENKVELTDRELVIKAEGRRYRIVEAVRVLGEVSDLGDPYDIVGRVKSVNFVTELGAELLETSMIVGDNAYDVVPGFLGVPLGTFDEHQATSVGRRRPARPGSDRPGSDEELLAKFLVQKLG
jgi:hypothetical protein